MRRLAMVLSVLVLGGCATAGTVRAPVDVAGRWTGTWMGHGVALVPRDQEVSLDLIQAGAIGKGRLLMHDTLAAYPVPDSVRDAGMTGIRIVFDVSGSEVRLRHELGAELFEAEMVVLGDRMVGRALRTDLPIRFDLVRAGPQAASISVAPAAPPLPGPGAPESPRADVPSPAAEGPRPPDSSPDARPRSAPPPTEFSALPELRTIHFDFDRSEIRPGDASILDANAAWLRAHPGALVLIEGHCDERGTAEYNLALGERRARSTMAYLLDRGVADTRITITSYGFERPLCTEHTEACWSRNRRAGFLVK